VKQTVGVRLQMPTGRRDGAIVGIAGVIGITLFFDVFGRAAPITIPALLLLVPIAVTSVVAGWRIAVPLAIFAAMLYSLMFIPPVGTVQLGLTEDVSMLVTFVVVAVVVGALKSPTRGGDEDRAVLDDQRAVLLRGVSHDLRSPLTTIKAISTELFDSDARYDVGARHALLGRVVDESDRLDRIVGNLLSVSRVQAGALIPCQEPERIDQLIRRTADRLDRDGRPAIDVEVPLDLPDVSIDAIQIDQVLTNLLENAIRFSPPDSPVSVTASRAGDMVEILVRDRGPGFSAEAREHLYLPFRGGSQDSTGLGLVVCKAIVDAHGGTIVVRDEVGGGAGVGFTVPVDRPAVVADPGR
jgi:K+-sensing histidine kinase KdpD